MPDERSERAAAPPREPTDRELLNLLEEYSEDARFTIAFRNDRERGVVMLRDGRQIGVGATVRGAIRDAERPK